MRETFVKLPVDVIIYGKRSSSHPLAAVKWTKLRIVITCCGPKCGLFSRYFLNHQGVRMLAAALRHVPAVQEGEQEEK